MAMRHTADSAASHGGATAMNDMDGMDVGGVATYAKYSGWPELKEAFISGRLKAAYLLAPMAMQLADNRIPVRVVALGHRSGAVIMVRKEDKARNMGDLKGKRVAIPSRLAV